MAAPDAALNELDGVARAFDPASPSYRFRALFLNRVDNPAQRVRPANVDEATALALGRKNLLARLNNMRIDNMVVKRDKWGFMHESDVNTYVDMLKKIGDVDKSLDAKNIYTNELIDDINKFDVEAVRRRARAFKLA